jgi:hypothetical protein
VKLAKNLLEGPDLTFTISSFRAVLLYRDGMNGELCGICKE